MCGAILDSGNSVTSLVHAFKLGDQLAVSERTIRRRVGDELHTTANIENPFGTVCKTSRVLGKKGVMELDHANPIALLYQALCSSSRYADFLATLQTSKPFTITLYLDEATPGNIRRPDRGRAAQCMYWSILEYPSWFRSRAGGWHPFAYALVSEMKETGMTDSILTRFMLQQFSDDLVDQATGDFVVILSTIGGTNRQFAFKVKLQIADLPQHQKTFSITGHNGSVCCFVCQNCLGRCDYFEDDMLVHYKSSEYHKFIRHTCASFNALCDRVEHTALHDRPRLKSEQQACGIMYDGTSLIFDREARAKLQMPQAGYMDWMHIIVASGGFGQFEVNQVVLVLDNHVPTDEIDDWCSKVKLPQGRNKLKRHFFRDRCVKDPKMHIKAFASEVIQAIVLIRMFLESVISPIEDLKAALQDHIDCFVLLSTMVSILQRGDSNDIPKLRHVVQMHHILFAQLYPQCMKYKLHAMVHVADFWEFWQVLLSCFAPERYHKFMKNIMKFTYRRAGGTTLAYAVRRWLQVMQDEDTFAPTHFHGKVFVVVQSPTFSLQGHRGGVIVTHWCPKMQTVVGLVCKHDLVRFASLADPSATHLAFVVGFANLNVNVFVAVVQMCCEVQGTTLWQRGSVNALVRVDQIKGAVAYAELRGGFAPEAI